MSPPTDVSDRGKSSATIETQPSATSPTRSAQPLLRRARIQPQLSEVLQFDQSRFPTGVKGHGEPNKLLPSSDGERILNESPNRRPPCGESPTDLLEVGAHGGIFIIQVGRRAELNVIPAPIQAGRPKRDLGCGKFGMPQDAALERNPPARQTEKHLGRFATADGPEPLASPADFRSVPEEVAPIALPGLPLGLKHRDPIGTTVKEMAVEEIGGGQGIGNHRPQGDRLKLVTRDLMADGQEQRVMGWPCLRSNPETGTQDGHTEQSHRDEDRVRNADPRWSRMRKGCHSLRGSAACGPGLSGDHCRNLKQLKRCQRLVSSGILIERSHRYSVLADGSHSSHVPDP